MFVPEVIAPGPKGAFGWTVGQGAFARTRPLAGQVLQVIYDVCLDLFLCIKASPHRA